MHALNDTVRRRRRRRRGRRSATSAAVAAMIAETKAGDTAFAGDL